MDYQITCPYCFGTMNDKEVLFRSERVDKPEDDPCPDDYDNHVDFARRYHGPDKEAILNRMREFEFFKEVNIDSGGDESEYGDVQKDAYFRFWDRFGGTTESNPSDELLGVKAYQRRLIDPNNEYDRNYLKKQPDGRWLIMDKDGMAAQIELKSGELCTRRVCCHCHNPLPGNYGKSPVKFASVIGITGAGKTVYLSQLLYNMKRYCAKVGLSAVVRNSSTVTFLESNRIAANQPLPGSTPAKRFQQPLFYELIRTGANGNKITETFVLYDVAGEVFKSETTVGRFAPFIQHSDGLIILIDPMQFDSVSQNVKDGKQLEDPTQAIDAIHSIVSGSANRVCDVPCAVCVSKIDTDAVQKALSADLQNRLLEDVSGTRGPNGLYLPQFNARQYNPIVRELRDWVNDAAPQLAQEITSDYSTFSYFAFTALGCDVETRDIDGMTAQCPVGPIYPRRVEEPLLWLFNRLGYIGANDRLFDPTKEIVTCPECGSDNTDELPAGSYIVEGKFLRKKKTPVNRRCNNCGCQWMHVFEY